MLPFSFILSATMLASHKIATLDTLPEIEAKYYTTKDVSDILEITEYTVRKKIRNGDLKAETFPGHAGYRIKHEELQDYISRHHNLNTLEKFTASSPENFSFAIEKLEEHLKQNPESFIDSKSLQTFIDGKKIDLDGLNLRLRLLELDEENSIDFQRKKLSLELAINQLKAEIKAYEMFKLSAEQKNQSR